MGVPRPLYEFAELVCRMREAQKRHAQLDSEPFFSKRMSASNEASNLEGQVDAAVHGILCQVESSASEDIGDEEGRRSFKEFLNEPGQEA